jgi:sterol desaturase/sphingolipid hydroxylase (fatty acid hydroxylase superfamily)
MNDLLITHETTIRASLFMGLLGTMILCEFLAPRRVLTLPRKPRWVTNISIVMTDIIVLRLLFPVAAVETAVIAQSRGLGMLNTIDIPVSVQVLIAIVLLDVLIYMQHVLFHLFPWLWRVHRVHHTDLDFDATTAVRFHPVEIILSMLIKMLGVILIGPPVIAVIIYEIILNGIAVFNHSNVDIPVRIDALLRRIIVTPDMHRVHHSVIRTETDSNFGNFLSCWDRFFNTYREQPEARHSGMKIGLTEFRDSQSQRFSSLLLLPFQRSGRSEV